MTAKQRREAAQASMRVKRKQGAKVEDAVEEVVVRKSLLDEKVEMPSHAITLGRHWTVKTEP